MGTKVAWNKVDAKRVRKEYPTVESVREFANELGRTEGALRQYAWAQRINRKTTRSRALAASRKKVTKKTSRGSKRK